MKLQILFAALVLTFSMISSDAQAESVALSTGEILEGRLLDFPKEVTIELSDGTKTKISYEAISSIFKASTPPPFSPFPAKK
jgi:hypothetical protein